MIEGREMIILIYADDLIVVVQDLRPFRFYKKGPVLVLVEKWMIAGIELFVLLGDDDRKWSRRIREQCCS